jgi:CheY-like chemotaxis protein
MIQSGKLKFTIIDDDPINIFLVKGIIKSFLADCEVNSFTDPELALAYLLNLKTEDFENLIIFLDLNMPVMDGWDVLNKLTEHYGNKLPSNTQLYILSSSDIKADIDKSKNYEIVNGFLTKPLKLADVKTIIDYLEMAAKYNVGRVFTCLLSVDKPKAEIKEEFSTIINHARGLGMHVILDIAPSVFEKLEIIASM